MKSDAQLQQDVMNELNWEPTIQAAEIGVAVKDGVVTLSGTVDSYAKKVAAEGAVKRVAGVKAVAEEIKVKLARTYSRSDQDIARVAANNLEWNLLVPHDRVKVMVQDGQITLSGEVFVSRKNQCGGCRLLLGRGTGRDQLDHCQTAGADSESGRGEEENRRRT